MDDLAPQAWNRRLAKFREQDNFRAALEIAVTLLPFAALWIAVWLLLSVSYWLSLLVAIPAAGFLLRLFMIQHDCGHGALFTTRSVNDWVGRVVGILTLTPYSYWRSAHAHHHASAGNLDRRGIGDIQTLTVQEYSSLSRWRRLMYRLYRHPAVMFVLGPSYLFMLQHRFPNGALSEKSAWVSVMATNLGIAAVAGLTIAVFGWQNFLLVHAPITMLAASAGVWLFYVQHQFEDTYWDRPPGWSAEDAALIGSSYYRLPQPLAWLTANIGLHHLHHLSSRIPFYRLPAVLAEHPELANVSRLTIADSMRGVKLTLWDEATRKLISFRDFAGRRHREAAA